MNGELMDKYRNRNDTKKIKLFDDNHILGIHFAVSSLQLGEEAWFR